MQDGMDLLRVSAIDVGKRMREARKRKGLSLADLGRLTERSSQAVQQWEVGQAEPGLERLVAIAKQLEIDPIWLVMGVKAQLDPAWVKKQRIEAAIPEEDRDTVFEEDYDPLAEFAMPTAKAQIGKGGPTKLRGRRLRVIKRVETMPVTIADQNFASEAIAGEIVSHFECSEEAVAFVITTRRNAPYFEPGDLVVIDKTRHWHPGAMVLARHNKQLVFGQLVQGKDGQCRLPSPNKLWPSIPLGKPEDFDRENDATPTIVGVMIEHATSRSEWASLLGDGEAIDGPGK